jgi:hypothetical protein
MSRRFDVRQHVAVAIMGAFDGLIVVLGVLFSLAHHPDLILLGALGVALAEMAGMAGGQFKSSRKDGASVRQASAEAGVIAVAVFAFTMLPAVPYALLPAGGAMVASIVVFAVLGAAITIMDDSESGFWRGLAGTYGMVLGAAVLVFVGELIAGGVN